MSKRNSTHQRFWLIVGLLSVSLSFALIRVADGKLSANTIHSTAMVNGPGNLLLITGPITCSPGDFTVIRITITQRATGAIAEGYARLTGTGTEQLWEIRARTLGPSRFQPGSATAVAVATTSVAGQTTDAHQWLVNITLMQP